MVKNAISDYSSTAASNTDVGGVNVDEGMPPSSINNAIREIMSHLADLNAGSSSLGTIKVDNLQLDGNAITSTNTDGDITITPNGNGNVVLDGINYPQVDGTANYFLKTNGAGQLSFAQVGSASIVDNSIGATQLNVSGNGTSGQVLASDADGSFSWADSASPHSYTSVSGTTPSLDVGSYNFFNSGALTGNTTLSFTNVPTEAKWTYTFQTAYGSGDYNIATMEYTRSTKQISATGFQNMMGLTVNDDGTKFYTHNSTALQLTEWTTPIPYRYEYATITHILDVYDNASSETGAWSIKFGDSGTKLYLVGKNTDSVIQYNLSTAYDLSTATYDSSTSVASQAASPGGISFKSDGTKMYIFDNDTDSIYQYSLSPAWDSSTLSYDSVSASVSTYLDNGYDLVFSSNGQHMYMATDKNYDLINTYSLTSNVLYGAVQQYSLSTAWDLSTLSYVSSRSPQQVNYYPLSYHERICTGLAISPDDNYLVMLSDSSTEQVNVYKFGDLYSLTLPSSVQNYPAEPYRPDHTVSLTFYTADGGTNVYLVDQQQFPNK